MINEGHSPTEQKYESYLELEKHSESLLKELTKENMNIIISTLYKGLESMIDWDGNMEEQNIKNSLFTIMTFGYWIRELGKDNFMKFFLKESR